MNEVINWGFIAKVSDNDYILWSGNTLYDKIQIRPKADDIIYEDNQKLVGNYSCTIHASAGALWDLMNYNFNTTELTLLWNKAIEAGADPKVGWYFYKAVDLVRNYWNENKKDPVISFRVSMCSKDFYEALDKRHSIVCWYRGNRDYSIDKSDGVLDGTSFWEWKYGHCCRVRKINWKICVVDNYKWVTKYNIYEVKNIESLVKNGVFFGSGYLFLKKSYMVNIEDLSNEEVAQTFGLYNWERWEDNLTRSEQAKITWRMIKMITRAGVNIEKYK